MILSHSSLTNEFLSLPWQPKPCLQKISESRINSSCQTRGLVGTVGEPGGLHTGAGRGQWALLCGSPLSASLWGAPRAGVVEDLESDSPTFKSCF